MALASALGPPFHFGFFPTDNFYQMSKLQAQSTGAAALRLILQARPLALRVHRERAIVDKSTDLWAADLLSVAPCERTTAGRGFHVVERLYIALQRRRFVTRRM